MCRFAQNWADQLAKQRSMAHRPNNKYGENLYMKSGTPAPTVDGEMPVTAWYGEMEHYRFGESGFSSQTGHFTQVVWKATTMLGVGVAKNKFGETFVVANYDPPGNVMGQFNQNVPKKVV